MAGPGVFAAPESAVPESERELRARFAKIGIGPGLTFDASTLTADQQTALGDAVKAATATIAETAATVGRVISGWQIGAAAGSRAFFDGDWALRAAGAKLGIYGNTVIVDHGMGVQSLYAHLSSFAVHEGDDVKKGQTLGASGQTGLAGGDHLHFSMMVNGQFVNATEWWDQHWLDDRVLRKLREAGLPAAAATGATRP